MFSFVVFFSKVSNKTKVAGISGGTTAVLGGLAAGAGILLAPLTLGASLAITVAGVGVATVGGLTGASAAIANKVRLSPEGRHLFYASMCVSVFR